jgi:hypothetical protein
MTTASLTTNDSTLTPASEAPMRHNATAPLLTLATIEAQPDLVDLFDDERARHGWRQEPTLLSQWVASQRAAYERVIDDEREIQAAIEATHRPVTSDARPCVIVPEGEGGMPPGLRKGLDRLENGEALSPRVEGWIRSLGHPRLADE